MGKPGLFDPEVSPSGLFDPEANRGGQFDPDLIVRPTAAAAATSIVPILMAHYRARKS
jgi:hypothetical protein